MDYYSNGSTDLLQSIKDIGDTITLSINQKQVNDLSQLDISIFNNTNSDLENVPIYIDLYSDDGIPIPVFSTAFFDHNNSREGIQVQDASKSEFPGGLRSAYLLKIANRSSNNPVFKIRYLIEKRTLPKFKVQTSKKGLEVRELDLATTDEASSSEIVAGSLGIVTVMFIILFQLFSTGKREREWDERMRLFQKEQAAYHEQLIEIAKASRK